MASTMKRWIDEKHMERFAQDFAFLFERVEAECGEVDFRLRDNYFNLYYKGNSLAKVRVDRAPYGVEVHQTFADGHPTASRWPLRAEYRGGKVNVGELPSFFSKVNMDRMARKIKDRDYHEELRVEQMMITDSLGQSDLFFIDRQIQGGALGRARLDLLALRQVTPGQNRCRFVIVEVKLGNNPELRSKVGAQIQGYVATWNTESAFADFKRCYEQTYAQMHRLRLLPTSFFPTIIIEPPVAGCIVVAGYSGLGKQKARELQDRYPDLTVIHKLYRLTAAEIAHGA